MRGASDTPAFRRRTGAEERQASVILGETAATPLKAQAMSREQVP